jgi:hypothetical protein
MMKTAELKVGANIDIVFENEMMKGNAHFMKALVYDYEGSLITTSQTSPALNRQFLDRRIIVTFLVSSQNRILRFGFPARFKDLIPDYQLASNTSVEALVLKQYAQPQQVDFRMYFRVKSPLSSNISLELEEGEVRLIDISLGGAKFTCPKDYLVRPTDAIKVKLLIGRTEFNLKCRVCDVRTPYSSQEIARSIQDVSIQFERGDAQMETLLGKAILEIERRSLSGGKL